MNPLLEHLPQRLAGLLLLLVAMVVYEPSGDDLLNRLLIPMVMAAAAAMLVQNLAAVALGACLLAGIHSDLDSPDWIQARAYPVLAASAAAILLVVLGRRFRRRILETREARWAPRRGGKAEDQDGGQGADGDPAGSNRS